MRKSTLVLASIAILVICSQLLGACLLPDYTVLPAETDPNDASAGKPNGDGCGIGTECSSGNCADGVCCDSACGGTCETCNAPTTKGQCVPVQNGEDPENECPTAPPPAPGVEDGGSDGGAFTVPDAGLTSDDNQCAGKCNGKRACGFAGTERTCGTVFCGNMTEQGRASCDGKGHCLFGVEECSAYSCPNGSPGCRKTCAGEQDCLATHFCDVGTSTCKPKVSNGSACVSVAQCQSGNCVDNVCCNSECDIAGGTCKKPGSVGTCICSACPGGPCALYFQDLDGDGYGNAKGAVTDGTAAYGCAAGPAPPGFVANKLDCYDAVGNVPAAVHPNQAAGVYYASSYTIPGGSPSFDYDCNSIESKETPEIPNSPGCRYCRRQTLPLVGCTFDATCSAAGQASGLGCKPSIVISACSPDPTPAFNAVVGCGMTGTKYTCGTCPAAGTLPAQNTAPGTVQRCR